MIRDQHHDDHDDDGRGPGRGHATLGSDYYVGWAQSLYDPVMLPFTGYSVALRLALMSGTSSA